MGESAWLGRLRRLFPHRHRDESGGKETREEITIDLGSDGSIETRMTAAVMREYQYLAAHPCSCGGAWQRVGGWIGSGGPWFRRSWIATLQCSCTDCNGRKTFRFRLR